MALLATSLPAHWQRRVFALGGGPFAPHLRATGVSVDMCKRRSRLDPWPVAAVSERILALRPDVVHSWGWMSTLAAGPICRLLRVPLIDGTIRTGALQPEHLWLKRIGMACATTVVANSRAGAQAWGVADRAQVVYNGFDWSRLVGGTSTADDDLTPPRDSAAPFSVVMVGRMVPAKDFEVVIATARLLQKRGRACRFLLVGHGPQRSQLIAKARRLIADGIVAFPAPSMEVLEHVGRAQVGVLMTNPLWAQEGCSNAIMEYMASGLPVVCGEGGGNREVVVHGECGFVVPPADPEALAQKIDYLRDHDAERRAMGEAGRRRILDVFSVERMVADFQHIYAAALSG